MVDARVGNQEHPERALDLTADQQLRVAALDAAVRYHNHQFVRPSSVGATTQEFYDFLKGESHGKR